MNESCNQRTSVSSLSMSFTEVPPTDSTDFPGFCPDDPHKHTHMPSRYFTQRNTWLPFRAYCYLFLTEKIEWPDASASCVRHGKDFLWMVTYIFLFTQLCSALTEYLLFFCLFVKVGILSALKTPLSKNLF